MMYNSAVTQLVEQLKKHNPNLNESQIAGLLGLLYRSTQEVQSRPEHDTSLLDTEPLSVLTNNRLVQITSIPKETLKQFLFSIKDWLEEDTSGLLKVNKTGEEIFSEYANSYYVWNSLMIPTTPVSFEAQELISKLKNIRKKYDLEPKREYDQFFATEESSVKKFEIAYKNSDIKGKSIVMLGDDDLVSIVAGLSGASFKEILIIDVDRDILATIEKIAEEKGISNLKVLHHDIREELPPQYLNRYDTVITDPPYTKWGIKLFLNTSLSLLKAGDTSIHLYFGASQNEPFKFTKIQEIFSNHHLVIKDKIDHFCQYNGAESIGSNSSLYILKPTSRSEPIKDYMDQTIYTFETEFDEKFPYVDHVVAKLNNIPGQMFTKKHVLKVFGTFCTTHKLKVVDTVVTKFKGGGMTCTFVLSNSNLVVHTWPERRALHVDLITCEPIYKKNEIIYTLSRLFETKYVNIKVIE